mmetsp:Transcript_7894/g.18477  ORF Transcript_7894/g.18477 Transcript_7894/m.18477 type:complete len:970 (-) Transcript_7894:28-2937(-)
MASSSSTVCRLTAKGLLDVTRRTAESLPNLLFLGVDRYPLAAGLCDPKVEGSASHGPVLLAVCCVPCAQRLDEEVNADVRKLADGMRRPTVQQKARLLEFAAESESGEDVQAAVSWFDCADFRSSLLRGAPGCTEAIASEGTEHVLMSSSAWENLCSSISDALGPLSTLLKTKGYLSACIGPLQGLLWRAEKAQRDFTSQELNVVLALAERVVGGCAPWKSDVLQSLGEEVRITPWKELITELRGLSKEVPNMEPGLGELTEAWCEEVRRQDYKQFVEGLHKEPVRARPPLQAWLRRLKAPQLGDLSRGKSSPARMEDSSSPEKEGNMEMGKSLSAQPAEENVGEENGKQNATKEAAALQTDCQALDTQQASGGVAEVSLRESLVLEEEKSPQSVPEEELALDPYVKEMLEGLLPRNSEVVLMQQVGSFMYDLHVESSDRDFKVLYLVPPESLLGLQAPQRQFSRHVNRGFGADKRGEVEYSGMELGDFVGELARGNPRNVELLFSKKAAWRGWAWNELRAARVCFLTLRCVAQYLGFVADRLKKLKTIIEDPGNFSERRAAEASKLLYHAHHKLLDSRRVLACEEPLVQVRGQDRERIMRLRLHRAGSVEELPALYEEADIQRRALLDDLDKARSEKRLPEEVDAEALIAWLRSLRRRCALQIAAGMDATEALQPLDLRRTRTADDRAAICDLLAEVEQIEGVRIVYAGYELSSRTMGTSHDGSDHDIRCIFVHPRSVYFGLRPVSHSFQHAFPAGACSAPVEISGWEARHALQMMAKHSIAVLGALQSPTAFRGPEWQRRLLDAATAQYDREKVSIAWFWHAQQNYDEYIKRLEEPIRKKYVHVVRPLLSTMWLRQRPRGDRSWPPALIAELLAQTSRWLSDEEVTAVMDLVASPEVLSKALPRLPALDALIQRLFIEEAPAINKRRERVSVAAGHVGYWDDLCVELITEATAEEPYGSEASPVRGA